MNKKNEEKENYKGIHQRIENHSFIKLCFRQIYKRHWSSHNRYYYYFLLFFLRVWILLVSFLTSLFLSIPSILSNYGTFIPIQLICLFVFRFYIAYFENVLCHLNYVEIRNVQYIFINVLCIVCSFVSLLWKCCCEWKTICCISMCKFRIYWLYTEFYAPTTI